MHAVSEMRPAPVYEVMKMAAAGRRAAAARDVPCGK